MADGCFHVLAPDGALVGSFVNEEEAHAYAHAESRRPGAALPLELDNRAERVTRFVWPHRCESRRWMALDRAEICPFLPPILDRRALLPQVAWALRPEEGRRVVEAHRSGRRSSRRAALRSPAPAGGSSASRRELALRSLDVGWRAVRRGLEVMAEDLGALGELSPVDAVTQLELVQRTGRVLVEVDAIRRSARAVVQSDETPGAIGGPG